MAARRRPAVHRWSGRAYLFAGVFPGAVAVLTVAPFGSMGWGQQTGNTVLGLLWLATGIGVPGRPAAPVRRPPALDAPHVALTWSIVVNRVWLVLCLAVFSRARWATVRSIRRR